MDEIREGKKVWGTGRVILGERDKGRENEEGHKPYWAFLGGLSCGRNKGREKE